MTLICFWGSDTPQVFCNIRNGFARPTHHSRTRRILCPPQAAGHPIAKPIFAAVAGLVLLAGLGQAAKTIKPGWNLFTPVQDIQLGQEASQEIEQQVEIVNDERLTAYVARIGKRLADVAPGEKYPYSFKVVADPSINAFALPGGPMFVHTGLISAADNEAQLAGVLAH